MCDGYIGKCPGTWAEMWLALRTEGTGICWLNSASLLLSLLTCLLYLWLMWRTHTFPTASGVAELPQRMIGPYPVPIPNACRGDPIVSITSSPLHTHQVHATFPSWVRMFGEGVEGRVFAGGVPEKGRLLVCELDGHPRRCSAWGLEHPQSIASHRCTASSAP